uniref:protein RoBo-1-like n=1 Tax=Jaculus jaculus TaxID=51337 RepID=UPI001E1B4FE4|nr:protein RoBo-1-like [Jaculus jaculus]
MTWASILKNLLMVCVFTSSAVSTVVPSLSLMAQEKGCSTNVCAPLLFSATLGGQRTFAYEHQCCEQEQCNKDLQLSQLSSQTNGVECPACYNETHMSCDPVLLKCTGTQTRCIEVISTGVPTNGPSSLVFYGMGCATETACGLNMHVFGDLRVIALCTSTNGSPLLRSISPVLPGLLLLKVLL